MKILKQIGNKLFYRGGVFHPSKGFMLDWMKDIDIYIQEEKKVISIGAGSYKKTGVINIDPGYVQEDEFNIKAYGENLPFVDDSIDFVVCNAVLEHVKEPQKIIDEIYRVLKIGGRTYIDIAFMQPFHLAPNDYIRMTLNNLEEACSRFYKIKSGMCLGPGSALAKFVVEYNQLFFKNKILKKLIKNISKVLVAPFKYIDRLLINNKEAINLAGGVYFYGEKK